MSDEEIEKLETYLDGALPPAEAEEVCRRAAEDPALCAALDQLRAERAARAAAWNSYEPSPATAEAVAERTVQVAVRRDRNIRASRAARRATAVAACLALAFVGGWVARGRVVERDAAPDNTAQVALTDENGNVIAVQRFEDPRKARQFADDVDKWQSRRRRAETREYLQSSGEF